MNFVFKMLTIVIFVTFFAGTNILGEIPAMNNEAMECQLRDMEPQPEDPGFFWSIWNMVIPSKQEDPCSDIPIFPEMDSEMRVPQNGPHHFHLIWPMMMSVVLWLAAVLVKRIGDQNERCHDLRRKLALEQKSNAEHRLKVSLLEEKKW